MDPLQLFDGTPALLATTLPDGMPWARTVPARASGDLIRLEGIGWPLERPALVRMEQELTPALGATTFVRWAEARGTLTAEGLRIASVEGALTLPAPPPGILERLWARGLPTDALAIDALRDDHPSLPTPSFLASPPGTELRCHLEPEEREAAITLLEDVYWNVGVPRSRIATAVHHSTFNIGVRDAQKRLVGHARALSDGTKYAWIYDVVVDPAWRGKGLGQTMMRLMLEHPAVREAYQVLLSTRDAQALYAKFGFVDRATAGNGRSFPTTEMVLRRAKFASSPPSSASR